MVTYHQRSISMKQVFEETYQVLRNIKVAFHLLGKDMMKKIIITMIRPKLEYKRNNIIPPQVEAYEEIRKKTKNCHKDSGRT